jgi:MarR family transcriptional regulator, transcriptional regulator for hemolysin
LERRPHATDRRIRTLWLTPVGETAVAQVRCITDMVRREALADVPKAERERLLDTLLTLRANLHAADLERAA